mmetsp:Transcript_29298/g.48600  ORF Transcript_29298/g.48600 Transcript_29298/m.48600 type:complete len:89 (-) Transcript_29298:15-281(-)
MLAVAGTAPAAARARIGLVGVMPFREDQMMIRYDAQGSTLEVNFGCNVTEGEGASDCMLHAALGHYLRNSMRNLKYTNQTMTIQTEEK